MDVLCLTSLLDIAFTLLSSFSMELSQNINILFLNAACLFCWTALKSGREEFVLFSPKLSSTTATINERVRESLFQFGPPDPSQTTAPGTPRRGWTPTNLQSHNGSQGSNSQRCPGPPNLLLTQWVEGVSVLWCNCFYTPESSNITPDSSYANHCVLKGPHFMWSQRVSESDWVLI